MLKHLNSARLKVFGKMRPIYYNMIVPWNSPLKPIFNSAVIKLREYGTFDYLVMEWEGKDIASSGGAELYSSSFGQVILAMLMFSSYFGIGLLVLGFELIANKLRPNNKHGNQNAKGKPFGLLENVDLDNEFLKNQYVQVESYFGQPDQQLTEDVMKALKIVSHFEMIRVYTGKHEGSPWIFHNEIINFEFQSEVFEEANNEREDHGEEDLENQAVLDQN